MMKIWCPYCKKDGDIFCWLVMIPMFCLGFWLVTHFVPIILGWR